MSVGDNRQNRPITVCITTSCRRLDEVHASTLVFKTLRVGFPTADVRVFDISSMPEAAAEIQRAAEACGAQYHALFAVKPTASEIGSTSYKSFHALVHLRNVLFSAAVARVTPQARLQRDASYQLVKDLRGCVVMLQPDVCFWDNCEGWRFDALIAGRVLPMHRSVAHDCVMLPQLHPSFLWIENLEALGQSCATAFGGNDRHGVFDPLVGVLPHVFKLDGTWFRLDVMANLYSVIKDQVHEFGEAELSCYDHLFSGTYADAVAAAAPRAAIDRLRSVQDASRRDFRKLRGVWSEQRDVLEARRVAGELTVVSTAADAASTNAPRMPVPSSGRRLAASTGTSRAPRTIHVVTYCRDMANLYGSTLIFKTLRVGFPNARVRVLDNYSLPEAAAEIRALARDQDCEFFEIDSRTLRVHDLGRQIILDPAQDGSLIFLHPDVCFWEPCEDWEFDALIAGKFVPMHRDERTGGVMLPLFDPSFWWIPDARAFREHFVREFQRRGDHDLLGLFSAYLFKMDGHWCKADPGSSLYAAFSDRAYAFGETELDAYDHLSGGTDLETIIATIPGAHQSAVRESHDLAKRDYRALKGLWRKQAQYFAALALDGRLAAAPTPEAAIAGEVSR